MQILQLLEHHGVIHDDLWMGAFLPHLVFGGFMGGAMMSKLME